MVNVEDDSNNFDASTRRTVSSELRAQESAPEYTTILKPAQTGMIIGCHNTNMHPDADSL
jgi:hypothetical protein